MIHPLAFYTALLAAVAGVIVAIVAAREAERSRKAANIAVKRFDTARKWIEAQQIYAHCVEDELYQTRRTLDARPGELAYEAAARRLGAAQPTQEQDAS